MEVEKITSQELRRFFSSHSIFIVLFNDTFNCYDNVASVIDECAWSIDELIQRKTEALE